LSLSICMMELPPVALIALSTAICMAAYLGLAKIFRLSAFAEMTSIIKQILK